MKYLGLVVVALASCATGGHVAIAPLPPDPTPEQRMALWETYRPHGNVDEIVTVCQRNGGCERSESRVIIFSDGRIVRASEDLAPLVAPDSPTMVHSRRAQAFADRANWWSWTGLAIFAAGMIVGYEGFERGNGDELGLGIGLVITGSVVNKLGSRHYARNARNATSESFAAYPRDLADRLRLCTNGVAVVPCESAPPAPAAEPAPAPKEPATTKPERTGQRELRPTASSPGSPGARALLP